MTSDVTNPKTAIAVAPNGGRRVKKDHPAIPLTPAELAETAYECLAAGASMMHVHVRRNDGRHLLDAMAYREAISAIRARVGDRLIVQITTEALGIYTPAQQMAVLRATRPEAASMALREIVPEEAAEPAFSDILSWMKREHVLPQIILYEPAEAIRLADLVRRGVVPWPDIQVLYVLGRYTTDQTSQPSDLLPFLAAGMPRFANWSVCAFGRHEAACVTAAALLGGHVRVGFENNVLLPDGRQAPSNAALVEAVVTVLKGMGYAPCDAAGLRDLYAA
jgi:uncharacterized protein (DUF849 family)